MTPPWPWWGDPHTGGGCRDLPPHSGLQPVASKPGGSMMATVTWGSTPRPGRPSGLWDSVSSSIKWKWYMSSTWRHHEDDLKKLRRSAQPCVRDSKSSVNTRPPAIIRGLWIRNYRCRSERKQGRIVHPPLFLLWKWTYWCLCDNWDMNGFMLRVFCGETLCSAAKAGDQRALEEKQDSRGAGGLLFLDIRSNVSLRWSSQSQNKLAGTRGTSTEIRHRGFIRPQSRWLRWHVVRAFYFNLGMFSPGLLCL